MTKKILSNLAILVILSVSGFLLIANTFHIYYLTTEYNYDFTPESIHGKSTLMSDVEKNYELVINSELNINNEEEMKSMLKESWEQINRHPIIHYDGPASLTLRDLRAFDDAQPDALPIANMYTLLEEEGLSTKYKDHFIRNLGTKWMLSHDTIAETNYSHKYKMPSGGSESKSYKVQARVLNYYAFISEYNMILEKIKEVGDLNA